MARNTAEDIRIVIFEDDPDWQEMSQMMLQMLGVTVVAVVDNVLSATQDIIPQLESWGVTHALLDGNFSRRSDGSEGQLLAEQIRNQAPGVTIIGFSGGSQSYVDIPMGKTNMTEKALKTAFQI